MDHEVNFIALAAISYGIFGQFERKQKQKTNAAVLVHPYSLTLFILTPLVVLRAPYYPHIFACTLLGYSVAMAREFRTMMRGASLQSPGLAIIIMVGYFCLLPYVLIDYECINMSPLLVLAVPNCLVLFAVGWALFS